VRKQADLRKQELIKIAFHQFIQQGYEKTSIRSIVGEANGEIGMFYHHFSSKEEIFQAALEQYNDEFISKIKRIVTTHNELPFMELLKLVLLNLEQALNEYAHMIAETVDKQMLTIIHQDTMQKLQPIFCEILINYAQLNEISLPDIDICLLSNFLLYGMSAIIHSPRTNKMDATMEAIQILFSRILLTEDETHG